jgi:hypothetical protein
VWDLICGVIVCMAVGVTRRPVRESTHVQSITDGRPSSSAQRRSPVTWRSSTAANIYTLQTLRQRGAGAFSPTTPACCLDDPNSKLGLQAAAQVPLSYRGLLLCACQANTTQ